MKISQSWYLSWCLRFKYLKYINIIILHSLVLRVGKHNMGKVEEVKSMRMVRGIEGME